MWLGGLRAAFLQKVPPGASSQRLCPILGTVWCGGSGVQRAAFAGACALGFSAVTCGVRLQLSGHPCLSIHFLHSCIGVTCSNTTVPV